MFYFLLRQFRPRGGYLRQVGGCGGLVGFRTLQMVFARLALINLMFNAHLFIAEN